MGSVGSTKVLNSTSGTGFTLQYTGVQGDCEMGSHTTWITNIFMRCGKFLVNINFLFRNNSPQQLLHAHDYLSFIVNKRTDTWIYNLYKDVIVNNKLMSVFNASVLLLTMNFVTTSLLKMFSWIRLYERWRWFGFRGHAFKCPKGVGL